MPAKKKTARKAAQKPAKSFEESLWDTATKLCGSIESSNRTRAKRQRQPARVDRSGGANRFYTIQNVFYLPETSRWASIKQHAKHGDIAIKVGSTLTAGNPITDELAVHALPDPKTTTNQQGKFNEPTVSDRKSPFPAAFQFTEKSPA